MHETETTRKTIKNNNKIKNEKKILESFAGESDV